MRIVTSGSSYIDIDAYAGCVAYAELLNSQGRQAVAASHAPWNESIGSTVRGWGANLLTGYRPAARDSFTLVDVSDPKHFDPMVVVGQVAEVIDHHTGFEEYWRDRIGPGAHIEFIGAAATLIYERWKNAGQLPAMSQVAARLLLTAILDNTLNFGAEVTTERDREAYEVLFDISGLPGNWPELYFGECEQSILANLPDALKNDTKTIEFAGLPGNTAFGQLAVWDGQEFVKENMVVVEKTMSGLSYSWFVNIIALKQGSSFFITSQDDTLRMLEGLIEGRSANRVLCANRLWLRKEVVKHLLNHG